MFIFSEVLYKKPTLKILNFLHYIYKQLYKLSHIMRKSVFVTCEQQRCRSACVSAQSDQCLCCSLLRRYNIVYTSYIQNFKTLVRPCSSAVRFEPYLVANTEDRFSRDEAQIGCTDKSSLGHHFPSHEIWHERTFAHFYKSFLSTVLTLTDQTATSSILSATLSYGRIPDKVSAIFTRSEYFGGVRRPRA